MGNSSGDNFVLERRVALAVAVCVVAFVMYLVVRDRAFPDPNLAVLVRILLSLTIGVLGATIPGFLRVSYTNAGFSIRAAGGLALFVITFFGTPYVSDLHLDDVKYLELQNQIGIHLANRNNCGTALREAEQLVLLRPKDPVPQNLKGDASYCLGQIDDALRSFDASLAIDPVYGPAIFNKAAALLRKRDYAGSKNILERLVSSNGAYDSARYNLAVGQAALGNFGEAFSNFGIVYRADKSFDAALGLGFMYLLRPPTSEEDASNYFRIAIGMKPMIVCYLYGKRPNDLELQENDPYVDIYGLVSKSEAFLRVRSKFDDLYKNALCEDT